MEECTRTTACPDLSEHQARSIMELSKKDEVQSK